jgi:hypothetical protein
MKPVFLLFVLLGQLWAEPIFFDGYVVTKAGKTYAVTKFTRIFYNGRFGDTKKNPMYVKWGFREVGDSEVKRPISFNLIKKVEFLKVLSSKYLLLCSVELVNGKRSEFYYKYGHGGSFGKKINKDLSFEIVDDFSGETQSITLSHDKVQTIAFNSSGGNLKFNPENGAIFPIQFNFDPFTGKKLKIKPLQTGMNSSKTRPLLRSASGDMPSPQPTRRQAQQSNPQKDQDIQKLQNAAVKFSLDMLNPLKSSAAVDQSLDKLRETANEVFSK